MESIVSPLRALQEDAAWFARATELKLMLVETSRALADAALRVVMGQSYHADNRSLFFRFVEPVAADGKDWDARAQGLSAEWNRQREGLSEHGIRLAPLPEPRGAAPVARFANACAAAAGGLSPPLRGLVLVLAPVQVEDATGYLAALRAFVRSPHLAGIRLVLVDCEQTPGLRTLVQELGEHQVLVCSCPIDEHAQQRDLEALAATAPPAASQAGPLDSAAGRPPGAAPAPGSAAVSTAGAQVRHATKLGPGAGPDVPPPPRLDATGEPTNEALLDVVVGDVAGQIHDATGEPTNEALPALGLSPAYVEGGAEQLRELVLAGALALRRGHGDLAIQAQRRAAELCGRMSMPKEQVINLLVLGGYVLASGVQSAAVQIYESALAVAVQHNLASESVQARLALGMLAAVGNDPPQAMAHYSAAAIGAETAGLAPLAIECWRMAGQLAAQHGAEPTAMESFSRALALAGALAPEQAKATSAAESARLLATFFRDQGMTAQADSLEEMSFRLEHGLSPDVELARA